MKLAYAGNRKKIWRARLNMSKSKRGNGGRETRRSEDSGPFSERQTHSGDSCRGVRGFIGSAPATTERWLFFYGAPTLHRVARRSPDTYPGVSRSFLVAWGRASYIGPRRQIDTLSPDRARRTKPMSFCAIASWRPSQRGTVPRKRTSMLRHRRGARCCHLQLSVLASARFSTIGRRDSDRFLLPRGSARSSAPFRLRRDRQFEVQCAARGAASHRSAARP